MPKQTKQTDKTQAERFTEAAREHEADETGKAFERAFGKIVPAKSEPKKTPAKPSGKERG
jgi:hypothetical protein